MSKQGADIWGGKKEKGKKEEEKQTAHNGYGHS
jgi:hypothetical protein